MVTTECRTGGLSSNDDQSLIDARVVFLTHYIPLYQVRVLQSIAQAVRDFHVLLSTPIEPNRDFQPDWSGLDVTVQDTWTVRRRWRHPLAGFVDQLYVHLPYDTGQRLRRLQPDIVMSLELGMRSFGAARYCRRESAKLMLCTFMSERTETGRGWLRCRLRRWLLRQADAVTFNGPSCRRYLKRLNVPDHKLHFFPYAADDRTACRAPVCRNDASTRHQLLCVGQLTQRKGVLLLLEQMSQYCLQRPHRKIELTFAGDGPLREAVSNFRVPANLNIEVLGNISPLEVSQSMLRSGALVAPTLADEWMLTVDEALQAGLPVIGSIHSQAVTTLVENGYNGWRFDPAVNGSLEKMLDHYFGHSAERIAAMRESCRASVQHRTPQWAAGGALETIRALLDHQANQVQGSLSPIKQGSMG